MQETIVTGACSHIGLVRQKNEDCYAILGNGYPCALILADGMGGHRRGELASRMAVDYAVLRLNPLIFGPEHPNPEMMNQMLTQIVEKANVKIYLSALSDENNLGMGTTLTIAVLFPNLAVLAHVGDCRAYLLHRGQLKCLTSDHTLVQELVNAGSISPDESRQHPKRHVLTRALGVPDLLVPDILTQPLTSGDRLLLCSDGLYSQVTEEQIKEYMMRAKSAEQLAETLVQLALALGGEDNITALTAFV